MKAIALLLALVMPTSAATLLPQWKVADSNLASYFATRTAELSKNCLGEATSAEDWKQRAPVLRTQLAEMLGLSPLPARGDLKATVTGRLDHDEFTVEKLHFQSRPQLYVTANIYIPKRLTGPAPTVLYVCGHSPVITNGVSYGTKAAYQHHGIWFARNGYICMIVDTLESGEILGQHHGTHNQNMWWWNSRGYTPAGVETWNGMRALDYLSTRPEVDTNRFAVTGRSGGGAQSWHITAMDERIKCAAPVAGITDLENHVVDGAVEGHCDCMYFVNTHRWDFPQLAALAAPRPLLFCNTDVDSIFPLDGVVRTHAKIRDVYEAIGVKENLGLVITPGPHKDTQELQVPVMRWFNQHLRKTNTLIENAAVKLFAPQALKVFSELPSDSINSNIHFSFVEAAKLPVPATKAEWIAQKNAALKTLSEKSFGAWRGSNALLERQGTDHAGRIVYSVRTGQGAPHSLLVDLPKNPKALTLIVGLSPSANTQRSRRLLSDSAVVRLDFPRLRTNDAPADVKKEIQLRRRFMLLGETIDSHRVGDMVQVIAALRSAKEFSKLPLRIEAEGDMAVNALYASLFTPVDELVLTRLPNSHMNGPDYLNVLRVTEMPRALAMASERSHVELREANQSDWAEPMEIAKKFGWEKHLRINESQAAGPR
ncbi:MAG TPA: alpha/beta hydrolase family protein [Candidatus Acidoferrum sp.]|nr:alpha/beta hydrolase family protein [Candidatus Acidoferrum sp.]